jgi:hypothetical protein
MGLGDARVLVRLLYQNSNTVLLGNSVNLHVSKCDTDRRNIGEFMASGGIKALDLSRPGSDLSSMMRYARLAAGFRSVDVVVIPLNAAGSFLHGAGSPYGVAEIIAALSEEIYPPAKKPSDALYYKGVKYGVYSDYANVYFPIESSRMQCPETLGFDKKFIEFIYWSYFGRQEEVADEFAAFISFQRELSNKGVTVIAVLMPQNLEAIRLVNGREAHERVLSRIKSRKTWLQGKEIQFLDLSNALPAEDFADQWCGCGHLNERGRAFVARNVVEHLQKQ